VSEHRATRTLVKSPPELWLACSEAVSLGRHLDSFGEIKITRLEPETTVAWEGDAVSGTVTIEPTGWGTRVTLVAVEPEQVTVEPAQVEPEQVEPEAEPSAASEPEPVVVESEPVAAEPESVVPGVDEGVSTERAGFWARVGQHLREAWASFAVEPEPEAEVAPPNQPSTAVEPVLEVEPVVETEPVVEVETATEAVGEEQSSGLDVEAALDAALDSLGQAHHRPFSRG
jgi:hypothetical protein